METKPLIKFIATFMIFVAFIFTITPIATALTNRNGSITLHILDSSTKKPLVDVGFRLYHIASAQELGNGIQYEFIKPYDKANISLNNLQDPYLPVHLTYFATTRSLSYTVKNADETGEIVFNNLDTGLYLIVPVDNFDGYFMPAPFIINIPDFNVDNGTWEYDVIATPKMIISAGMQDNLTTYLSVRKVWEDNNNHPKSVKIILLRDMEEYATIELTESNNWYYRWDLLEKNHIWNIVESQVPEGYNVSYETSSNTVTIINTLAQTDESTTIPITQPDTPDEPTTTELITGETNTSHDLTTSINTQEITTEQDKLAQTGQLNWPIPVLSIAGLLFFSIGWAIINLNKQKTN